MEELLQTTNDLLSEKGQALQIYHENILLMENKHWKLFVTEKSKKVKIYA